ncbi:KpsF/GutQ family sugar-phosphate isomerase [Brachyspira aalborgi]|uniref:KpsF/GutQ family sugar-phosphate isomerase n=1 Tax=Brachyspira aalborgi TaxID=29522 RepID=UPI002665BF99|nr:SIS domain-containing protein [Brachyspira aalborgi]
MDKETKKIIEHVLSIESQSILEILNNYDEKSVNLVIKKIEECKGKIIISGCGTSGEAGRKIAHTLSCIECPSIFLSPSDALHGRLGIVKKEDIVILLSKGGETMELISMIPAIKHKKAFLIGVTENENSSLSKDSDIFLKVHVSKEADMFNLLATSSIVALIALFDAIIVAIMVKKNFTKKDFSVIHPGGAVGKKLTGKTLYKK